MKKKNNYKIKGIKNFLPAYCEYTTPKGNRGFDELYYSISSYDAVKDIKNIDYIGFWKEKTCWGDECGMENAYLPINHTTINQEKTLKKEEIIF